MNSVPAIRIGLRVSAEADAGHMIPDDVNCLAGR